MKSIIFLCLVFIVAVYVFLQWNGNNKIGSNTASPSGIAMSSNSFGSVLGMNTAELQGRVASQASAVVGSVSRVVQSRIEEMVRLTLALTISGVISHQYLQHGEFLRRSFSLSLLLAS